MVLQAYRVTNAPVQGPVLEKRTGELLAFCPGCKSFETIYFDEGTLMSTRKFAQRGDLVYHTCGSDRPCRLYRSS
jgi:hypothetical protein